MELQGLGDEEPGYLPENHYGGMGPAVRIRVPVVASAVGGMLDTVVDSVTGALVPPRDPGPLAEVIGTLLTSPSRRAEFARARLQRVRSRYAWDRIAADTAAVYLQTARRLGVDHALSAHLGLTRIDAPGIGPYLVRRP
jgi:glycosyltransferase involved in cell wall biosynthesis